jgi:hypothetical protein
VPKRGTFLLVVQTAVLANATSVASQPDKAAKYHHEVSAMGVLELMSKAVAVSESIPESMSVSKHPASSVTTCLITSERHSKNVMAWWLNRQNGLPTLACQLS